MLHLGEPHAGEVHDVPPRGRVLHRYGRPTSGACRGCSRSMPGDRVAVPGRRAGAGRAAAVRPLRVGVRAGPGRLRARAAVAHGARAGSPDRGLRRVRRPCEPDAVRARRRRACAPARRSAWRLARSPCAWRHSSSWGWRCRRRSRSCSRRSRRSWAHDGVRARCRALCRQFHGRVTDVRVAAEPRVHCAIPPGDVPALARWLRASFGAELILMVGADRRRGPRRLRGPLSVRPRPRGLVPPRDGHGVSGQARDPLTGHASTTRRHGSSGRSTTCSASGRVGHPDPRPLVRHAFWPEDYFPLRKDAAPRDFHDDGQAFPFQQVGGEGVYEIPVGPVHAGIIEPGHFRFSVVGETIIDMKSRLYFTHKGTEKLFEGRTLDDGVELAERVPGDTSVGHALAYCQAVEAPGGTVAPPRARVSARDPPRARAALQPHRRLRDDRQRHGIRRGALPLLPDPRAALAIEQAPDRPSPAPRRLRPGASRMDLPGGLDVVAELEAILADFDEIVEISLGNTLVADRLEGTGRLTPRRRAITASLGFVARASGLDVDARRDHPFAAYGELSFRGARVRYGRRVGPHAGPGRGGARVGEAGPAGRGGTAGRAAPGAAWARSRLSSPRSPWSRDGGGGSFTG